MSSKIIPIQSRTNKDIQETLRNPVDSNMGGNSLSKLHEEFSSPDMPEDKYLATAKGMLKYAMPAAQKNLSTVKIEKITRRTHIALILMPKWAVFFAPYNIARLAAVTRAAGYQTSVFDWNVDTWHKLKKVLPEDPYEGHGSRDYLWLDDMYKRRLQAHVEPILEEYLAKIIDLKPDAVGFSLYYTNIFPTLWLARKIREHLPDVKIIAGGSHIQWNPEPFPEFDHVVKGEGEELLLQMLDDIENNIPLLQPEKIDESYVATIKNELEKLGASLFIVVAYGKILPETLINIPTLGTLNIHYSLLPKWRGASPVESAILHGDTETGVSIQKMVFKLDAGPVIAEEKTSIHPNETAPELRTRLIEIGGDLLAKKLPEFVNGMLSLTKQSEELATRSGKIKKEDGLVNPLSDDPKTLWNKYRAYFGWPGIYFFDENNKRVKITDASLKDGKFVVKKIIPEGKKEIIISN